MLNVNVQTVALIAQQSALAHLYVVSHRSRNNAIESCKLNSYRSRANAVMCVVPPFLPPLKRVGFLEVFTYEY